MNNWNSIENQLRSWRPRRPSDRVERALFGTEASEVSAWRAFHLTWQGGWAAGLGTCMVLLITVLNFTHAARLNQTDAFIVPAVVSNASYAASFASVEHNCVSAPIFGWTKPGGAISTLRSLESFNTNHLLP